MAFSTIDNQLNNESYTLVDNQFIKEYMLEAPSKSVEVYLYGLAMARENDVNNSLTLMSRALNLSVEDILNLYAYWEDLGLVHLLEGEEKRVIYLPIRNNQAIFKKLKPSKYSDFTRQIQDVFIDRTVSTTEFERYYYFLEETHFEPTALVAVAKYCIDFKQDKNIGYAYVLAVARNMAKLGLLTLESVKQEIDNKSVYSKDLQLVFKALKSSRKIEYADRQLFDKWTSEYGFTLDTIIQVAKRVKNGGINRLDAHLTDYFKLHLMSYREIEQYQEDKQQLYELARNVTKNLGVYYQSLDMAIESYITPWKNKGFDDEALTTIAKQCFLTNTRTLDGMNLSVEKYYVLGCTTKDSVDEYMLQVTAKDALIKKILSNMELLRNVTAADRKSYKVWTENWQIDYDAIEYASALCAAAVSPMSYLNKILSDYKAEGIKTLTQAKARETVKPAYDKKSVATATNRDYAQHEYTKEQLRALVDNLDDVEV